MMTLQTIDESDPRIQAALRELRDLIQSAYPSASFTVSRGTDPDGIYLRATVDVDDVDEVIDVVIDRLVDLQVEDELPNYVIPVEPRERMSALPTSDHSTAAATRVG